MEFTAAFAPLDAEQISSLEDVLKFFSGVVIESTANAEKNQKKNIIIPSDKAGLNVPANWGDKPVPESFIKLQEEEKIRLSQDLAKFIKEFPQIIKGFTESFGKSSKTVEQLWKAWNTLREVISEKTGIAYKAVLCKGLKNPNHSIEGCRYAHSPSSSEDLKKTFEFWSKIAKEVISNYNTAKDESETIHKRSSAAEEAMTKIKMIDDRIKRMIGIIRYETDTMIWELRILEQNPKLYSELHKGPSKWNSKSHFAPVPELVRKPIEEEKEDKKKPGTFRKVLVYAPSGKQVASCYHGARCKSVIETGKCKHLHKKEHIVRDDKTETEEQ